MRVGIDVRALNREHVRGMGKYLFDMMTAASALAEIEWVAFSDRPDLPFHRPLDAKCNVDFFDARGYRVRAWEQYALPRRARAAGVDILHSTATTLPWWQPVPTVVTIHDTVPWTGEPCGEPSWFLERVLPRAYRKCAAIITISESSRRDIVSLWPDVERKVHVIPHGIDERYFADVPERLPEEVSVHGVKPPYILYLGGAIPRKRLDWAIEVVRKLSNRHVRLAVVGVGDDGKNEFAERLEPDLRQRVCFLPYVSEAAMPALYRNAVAVLYPTLYEGFGFPAVEAQAVGTPVLFSRVGSLEELEGPGAVVLPTNDLAAWVSICESLLKERNGQRVPNEAARRWARRFSWATSAERHFKIYEMAKERRAANKAV